MNGYSYNGGYDGGSMDQGNQNGGSNMMMMGQENMGGNIGGGQSLDEIVNQNAKVMRRQSMPHQYGGAQNHVDTDMRRVSMMDYGQASPVGPMGNFQYDPNAGMDQGGMMSGKATPAHNQHQQDSHSRRQSHTELALDTAFGNSQQGYNGMMPPNSAYQSPAHPQSGFDMNMDNRYLDSGMNMQMDYNVDQHLGNDQSNDMPQMNMYNHPQFNQNMVSSPMAQSGTPQSAQGPSQDPGGGSNMGMQYGSHRSGSGSTVRQMSRSQSLHLQDTPGTQLETHSSSVTTMSQQPASRSQPQQQDYPNSGFQGQPQNPQPGSAQDRGMHTGTQNSSHQYDGVNGPTPVNAPSYNPNNQGFEWDAGEGGWPSTMVGKPHMQTSFKNAYSSTGFDMLGVLVRYDPALAALRLWLTQIRCVLRHDQTPKSTSAL